MTLYAASFSAVAVTAQQDLFAVVAPATGIVVIHRATISQHTEVGDAQEEALLLTLRRGATTAGSVGTVVTPAGIEPNAPAFGGSVRANDTTVATGGTVVPLHVEAWNVRSVFDYLPTPECRPVLAPSQRAVLHLGVATAGASPADSLTVSGTLVFEALGG